MSDKLDRFTRNARHTLTIAQESALGLNHPEIRPEHMLLALAREQNSMVEHVLHNSDVEPAQVMRAVQRAMVLDERKPQGHPSLADSTKRLIERAVEEMHQMEHYRIATTHFLLAMLQHEEGTASQVLHALGIQYAPVRTLTQQLVQQRAIPEAQEVLQAGTEKKPVDSEDGESDAPSPSAQG